MKLVFQILVSLFIVLPGTLLHAEHPFSGGGTTIVIPKAQLTDRGAFSRPAPNLSLVRRGDHFAGNSFFQNAWVTAPASTKARDGLGPLFNTMSCQSCHIKDGRGRPPRVGEDMVSMLLRVSEPKGQRKAPPHLGVLPHPSYGIQIQSRAVQGVKPEAKPRIEWDEFEGKYADGTSYSLRRPKYILESPAYGRVGRQLEISGRVAPVLVGVGLLDTLDEKTILRGEDPDDKDGDGVSGRANWVWDVQKGGRSIGRFGWKAEQPNIRQQVAAAFSEDIGITSSLFPAESLTAQQAVSVRVPDGGRPEVSDEILKMVTFYCKTLAVPARRGHESKSILEGEFHFRSIGCTKCHTETMVTGNDPKFPELSSQQIHPYTDMLLHDMGEGLADNRPVFEASGREWRTPPLWGIGVIFRVNRHNELLHDGRARNFAEAILWHGGEAERSKQAFVELPASERRKLLAFLKSL